MNTEKNINIAVGADHQGFLLKKTLIEYLKKSGYEVSDQGTSDSASCDYPIFAKKVAEAVARGEADYGVLICGTGIGMSIAANKVKNARAALVCGERNAFMSRAHNNANIICFSAHDMEYKDIVSCLDVFLKTAFEGGRHERRVNMFEN
ncbi:MAG: ribose 5-phosphate isomerase B [Eubacteriales bacterium]